MKFLRVLCVLALAAFVTASAYAETQSVKVSGDLTIRGIYRDAYTLNGAPGEGLLIAAAQPRTAVSEAGQSWFMSAAEIEIDADLTDNVQTVIRLANQRDWNVGDNRNIASNTTLAPNGRGGYLFDNDQFDIGVDLAYVTLKDFIYSPLTLTIGRQDLWFGKGFIIGANQQVYGAGTGNMANNILGGGSISAPEYTAINSFDAIKAVLDYDPWTITSIYSKIFEAAYQRNDDEDLWGTNVGYKFDAYKAEAEGYWFYKHDKSIDRFGPIKSDNNVHTIGLRGSVDPIDVMTVNLEGAFQLGEYLGSRLQAFNRDRVAYALDAGAEWRYWTDKFAWKPKLGVEYILYSGNEPESNPLTDNGDFNGWDPMFRGKFDSAIREFIGRYYATQDYPVRPNMVQSIEDASFTNQHQIVLIGSLQPIESLLLKGNVNFFWLQEDLTTQMTNAVLNPNNRTTPGGYLGTEIDLQATWDYTEDVSFNVLAAWFVPDAGVYLNNNDSASEYVGSVKVSF